MLHADPLTVIPCARVSHCTQLQLAQVRAQASNLQQRVRFLSGSLGVINVQMPGLLADLEAIAAGALLLRTLRLGAPPCLQAVQGHGPGAQSLCVGVAILAIANVPAYGGTGSYPRVDPASLPPTSLRPSIARRQALL